MLDKFILFSLFGIFVPVFIYFSVVTISNNFSILVRPVGDVKIVEDSVLIKSEFDKKSESVVLVGDVLLARNIEYLLQTKESWNPLVNSQEIFKDAPIVIGNFESAILENHVKTPSYVTTFSVDKKFLPLLTKAGFTHVSLANNHSFDYGTSTYAYTVDTLFKSEIIPVGNPNEISTSSVTLIDSGDFTIGLLAFNEIFTPMNRPILAQKIRELSEISDFQIAYVHWGEEYKLKHNQNQEKLAYALIDDGIDAVFGLHPHVTQDIAVYKNKAIFYSLGNFLFDQYFSVDVQQGLAVTLMLSSSTVEYTITPVSSENALSQPHLMESAESTLFLKNLSRRSDPGQAENIAQGRLILPFKLATSS